MWAVFLDTIRIDMKRMVVNGEAAFAGDLFLARLDGRIVELLDMAALQTNDVVVVLALIEFEHRFAALEIVARQQPGLFELRQHAVDRGQPNVVATGQQVLVHVFRAHVALLPQLEQPQYLESRHGRFEPGAFQMIRLRFVHSDVPLSFFEHHARMRLQLQMRTIIICVNYRQAFTHCHALDHPGHPASRRARHYRRDPRRRSPASAPARAGLPQRQADRTDPQSQLLRPIASAHRHYRYPAAAQRGRQNYGVQSMKRIALLGMPNTGKSTLFNRMTGGAARVGNWPGITVELLSGKILLGGDMVEVIDLPGIYDLHGFSDDEQVVRHFLHDNVPDLALVILNATQIERQMSLLLQLKQLNMNLVVLLNMADEARKYGITIDSKKMSELLE